jgi:hypothetical protein
VGGGRGEGDEGRCCAVGFVADPELPPEVVSPGEEALGVEGEGVAGPRGKEGGVLEGMEHG